MQIPPDISKASTIFASRLQLVLLGDSLTQRASEQGQTRKRTRGKRAIHVCACVLISIFVYISDGWATLLSHYYSRKSDTFNRGYSGYNSNHILSMVEQHIAAGAWPTGHAASAPSSVKRPPTLLTLCLGANDSCLKDGHSAVQSVPLEQYRENLASIIKLLKGADGTAAPELHIIVIGPPQVDDPTWGLVSKQKHGLDHVPVQRNNDNTKLFSIAAGEVAAQFKLPFIDMYSLTSDWNALLVDGLHFNTRGNHLLFTQLIDTIKRHYPHLQAENLPVDSFPFMQIETRTLEDTKAFFDKAATQKQVAPKL